MFRFSIREVLLVTALAGVSIGWWVDRASTVRARKKTESLERGIQSMLVWIDRQTGRKCIYVDEFDGRVYGDFESSQYVLETDMQP